MLDVNKFTDLKNKNIKIVMSNNRFIGLGNMAGAMIGGFLK